MIVTTLDTFTSLLSGITIFGILGNLATELNQEVQDVVGSGGTGLAFVSYPDAISKTFMPQVSRNLKQHKIFTLESIAVVSFYICSYYHNIYIIKLHYKNTHFSTLDILIHLLKLLLETNTLLTRTLAAVLKKAPM